MVELRGFEPLTPSMRTGLLSRCAAVRVSRAAILLSLRSHLESYIAQKAGDRNKLPAA
jgi:hypothetical protein